MRRILYIFGVVLPLLALQCITADQAFAEADGVIIRQDNVKIAGTIRWLNAAKKYEVTTKQGGVTEVQPDEVADVSVAKPANLDKLAGMVNAGQGAAAIPELTAMVEKYLMLQWDMPAATYLIKACKDAKSSKGIELSKKVADNREGTALAQTPEFMSAYIGALIDGNKLSDADKAIQQAIQAGTPEAVSVAYLKRGDLLVTRNNHKDALVDGFLRTMLMYPGVKSIQPEAIYKAVKCLEQLKQATHADKWRKKLLAEYPSDPYTAKLRSTP